MENITSDRKITCPQCGAENISWRSRCERCGEELHKSERKMPHFEKRGTVFWIAFGFGVLGLPFLALVSLFTLRMASIILFTIMGLALCWKWPKLAGATLVVGGISSILILIPVVINLSFYGYLVLILGIVLPLIGSGILFFVNGRG